VSAFNHTGAESAKQIILAWRIILNDDLACTADLQYMDEDVVGGNGPKGWIPGFRVTAAF
jgi:hypothetical protein